MPRPSRIALAVLVVALLLAAPAHDCFARGEPHASGPVPIDASSQDARILACRMSKGPRIDAALALELDSTLARARRLSAAFDSIHAFPKFELTTLLVKLTTEAGEKWRRSDSLGDDPGLDSLGAMYSLVEVRQQSHWPKLGADRFGMRDWLLLRFAHPLNMAALAKLYARSPAVLSAEPNYVYGDGDHIYALRRGRQWLLVFSRGWGDCLDGCTERTYAYVTVDASGRAEIVDQPPDLPPSRFLRGEILNH